MATDSAGQNLNGHSSSSTLASDHEMNHSPDNSRTKAANFQPTAAGQSANGADLEKAQTHDPNFEVSWDGDDDPENPRSMSKLRKWMIVLIVSMSSTLVTCTSSIYTTTYAQIIEEWGCSQELATAGLSFFVLGLGLGPMLTGPLSEFYGRRNIYIVSLSLLLVWFVPCAAAQNIQTELIGRFFTGLTGATFLVVSGGTVGDLFTRDTLQAPMMIFTASPFLGPELGPLIGGFINQYAYWRWTFYTCIIWTAVMLLLVICFVPDTYHPVLLRRKAERLRKETGDQRWHAPIEKTKKTIPQTILTSVHRPFMLLCFEPMVLCLCVYSAIILGIVYLFFGAFGIVFVGNHDFELWQVGLSFMGMAIGMVLAISSDPLWQKNYLRLKRNHEAAGNEKGSAEPEFRLPPSLLGGVLAPIGLFWFGWTSYSSIHWIVPIIGSAFFGASVILNFSAIFTFLVDSYPLYAASALAANGFVRSLFAAAFPLFGDQMYHNLGDQWASSLLAFLCLAMMPFPWIFYSYGKRIRRSSRFATSK